MASLEEIVGQIREVRSLPTVAVRVIEIVNDPQSSGDDLKSVIENDPSLAARVLRTVNSPLYGIAREVRNVQQAVGLLGFREIRNLAVTAAIADYIKRGKDADDPFSRERLWRHLVSVGVASRLVAARCSLKAFEDAFLAGLLHDLGIVLFDQAIGEAYTPVVRAARAGGSLPAHERAMLGCDHAELGARVAEEWRFPTSVTAAIRFHHGAQRCSDENRPLVQAVEVANFLCTAKGTSSVGNAAVEKPDPATLAELSIGRNEFRALWEDFETEVAGANNLLLI